MKITFLDDMEIYAALRATLAMAWKYDYHFHFQHEGWMSEHNVVIGD